VVRLGRQIAQGLEAAHKRGLIHRDIKPANIWLEADTGRLKILDFGLARAAENDQNLTQSGAIVGTPAYMAPEQASGDNVDQRSDLFSLGCVLYRMAAGELPFKGKNAVSTLLAMATQQPKPPSEVNPEIPPALSKLILRLLAKNPAERPDSTKSVLDSLAVLEERLDPKTGQISVPADQSPARSERTRPKRSKRPSGMFASKNRLLIAAVAVGILVVVVSGICVYLLTQLFKSGPEPVAQNNSSQPGKTSQADDKPSNETKPPSKRIKSPPVDEKPVGDKSSYTPPSKQEPPMPKRELNSPEEIERAADDELKKLQGFWIKEKYDQNGTPPYWVPNYDAIYIEGNRLIDCFTNGKINTTDGGARIKAIDPTKDPTHIDFERRRDHYVAIYKIVGDRLIFACRTDATTRNGKVEVRPNQFTTDLSAGAERATALITYRRVKK
jgi:uncharacterized protein (TIGR03067 family)